MDEECYEILMNCGDIPTFTLSWLLTWYSHVLPDFSHVQRIFDACLSKPPIFSLYLIVATILHHKESLITEFDEDDPHTSLYMVFQKINNPDVASQLDVNQLVLEARDLYIRHPASPIL